MKRLFLILVLLLVPLSLAYDDCPNRNLDCSYPGECGAYVDIDNNNLCDHGEPIPTQYEEQSEEVHDLISGQEIKLLTVKEAAEIYQISSKEYANKLSELLNIKVSENHPIQTLHDSYGLEPSMAKEVAQNIKNEIFGEMILEDKSPSTSKYNLGPILLVTIFLYLITFILSKKKIISVLQHRKIWNIILTSTALMTALLGIFLIINIDYGPIIQLPFSMIFWHVEVGIPFTILAIFHASWHWPYFKNIFKIK